VHLKDERLNNLRGDWSMVAACFVIPYPPGFPILVPGQIITDDVINFFRHLVPFFLTLTKTKFSTQQDVHEIHGYNPKCGLRVFKSDFFQTTPSTI